MTTWSQAFAAQAESDLSAYEYLNESNLPVSHRLHYLQMWLEKLCKAYLWRIQDPRADMFSHNVIAKVLPSLVREHWRRVGLDRHPDFKLIREICREIDLLQPQIRNGENRPDNSEYPWLGLSGSVEFPANWQFPIATRLYTNPGKLLIRAAERLARDRFA